MIISTALALNILLSTLSSYVLAEIHVRIHPTNTLAVFNTENVTENVTYTIPPTTAAPTDPCTMFRVKLKTDEYPEETKMFVIDENKNIFISSEPLESSTDYEFEDCLPEGKYEFLLFDAGGDRINDRMCKLFLDGKKLK